MEIKLPYKAEYAKSGRSRCRECRQQIGNRSVRIAVLVQSSFGLLSFWHHVKCFCKKIRPTSAGLIANFHNLTIEDQQRIKEEIAECNSDSFASNAKNVEFNDFGIEYAKSARNKPTCRICKVKIMKSAIYVRKTGLKYSRQFLKYHLECFSRMRHKIGWLESGEFLPGYKSLKKEDQAEVKNILPPFQAENTPEIKLEVSHDSSIIEPSQPSN